jgi:hypothetical protein
LFDEKTRTMTALPSLPDQPQQWRMGLIGYGEVGRILAEDLCAEADRLLHWYSDNKKRSP